MIVLRALLAPLVASSLTASASEPSASGDPGGQPLSEPADGFTGEWGGTRRRLAEAGLVFEASYTADLRGPVAGGLGTGLAYDAIANAAVDVDLERALRLSGTRMRVSALFPHGDSPSGRFIGDVLTASNIDAFRDDPALDELWFEQDLGDTGASLRAGVLLADTEFAQTEAGGEFVHSSFGWPAFVSINTRHTGPAFFRAALGVRLRIEPASGWTLQAGVYDGDTFDGDPDFDRAESLRLRHEDGIFAVVEVRRSWNESDSGAPRTVAAFGGWFHSGARHGSPPVTARHPSTGGCYAVAEHALVDFASTAAARPTQVATFFRAGVTPGPGAVARWAGDVGIVGRGFLPAHFDDALACGFFWATFTDRHRDTESDGDYRFRAAEAGIEVTWSIRLTSWCRIQPGYQWITFPGGRGEPDDAHVAGLRTKVSF